MLPKVELIVGVCNPDCFLQVPWLEPTSRYQVQCRGGHQVCIWEKPQICQLLWNLVIEQMQTCSRRWDNHYQGSSWPVRCLQPHPWDFLRQGFGWKRYCSEMEKAYKIALAKLRAWQISTQNMCKKQSKLCKNEQNCKKLHTKGQKPFKICLPQNCINNQKYTETKKCTDMPKVKLQYNKYVLWLIWQSYSLLFPVNLRVEQCLVLVFWCFWQTVGRLRPSANIISSVMMRVFTVWDSLWGDVMVFVNPA